ncbi:MAG TPA: 2-dehydro-3-deoxyphosphooctonate aldolase [Flavobacterium sp.]
MKTKISMLLLLFIAVSCISTKSTIMNVDDTAPIPTLTKENTFVITEFSNDNKYGYNPDYPINVFFRNTRDEKINQERFLNALAGPKGEKISFTKIESCCPFPTKKTEVGAGFLDVYELTWAGKDKPVRLYLNMYEKGKLMVPVGLGLKKQ